MRVLAITNEFPLPLDRGGPVRSFGLARALAERHELHLLALRRPSTTDALIRELESVLGGPVEVFDPPPPWGGPARRWLRGIAAGAPPWVREQFSPELERRARECAGDTDVVVLLDDYAGAYAAGLAPLAPVVADKHNILGFSSATGTAAGLGVRIRQALDVHLIRRFERNYIRRSTAVVVTSKEEAERLETVYGRHADAVVPSAIDLPPRASGPSNATVGWLGTHEYEPNVEGLLRFVHEGWEPIAENGTRLLIAGGSPPPSVTELGRVPGVDVLGYVDDLDSFLASLTAAVVPLWSGAGLKLKTLTFMGAGVPVAATSVAIEGIEARHGRECLLADDPRQLAAAVGELLADPARAGRIGDQARTLVAEGYTWPSVAPRFLEAVERASMAPR